MKMIEDLGWLLILHMMNGLLARLLVPVFVNMEEICENYKTELFKYSVIIKRHYKYCLAVNQQAKLRMFWFC